VGEGGSRLRLTDEESDFEETKIVRTYHSNNNWIIVHFFVKRQRNEPKKTFMGENPHVPPVSRVTRKKRYRIFC
jgi:hypothetical protein